MNEGYEATGDSPHGVVPGDSAVAVVRLAPAVLHRRRRAGALAALAGLALLLGAVVGAISRPPGSVAHAAGVSSPSYFRTLGLLAGKGPASIAGAEARAENAAINRTLAYTPFVRIAGAQHREVALTFDDGPGPYTPEVLRELERLHVPATFFEVGIMERYFHAATSAIVARGYPIGDHTELHAPMSELTRRQQQSELLQQADAIGDYGAPFPRLFRPPYGLWSGTTLSLLHKYRMLMVLWSVDTNDYLQPGVDVIVQRALAGAQPGAIILLHDAGGNRSQTVAALPRIVRGLRARGYRLVTIPRLLLDNPAPHDQDVAGLQGAGG
jgi:peptidoglycan-N-acetylglucosamine deacetylase